jgi:hypothetical protein
VRGLVAAGTVLSLLALPLSADADPTPRPSPAPSATTVPGGEASAADPTPAETSSTEQAATPSPEPHSAAATATDTITLSVAAAKTPIPGRFFEDIGTYAISGSVGADDATATVAVYRRATSATTWTKITETPADASGSFAASVPVTERGGFTFAATIGGSPSSTDALVSDEVAVTVENSYLSMDKIVASVDALKDPVAAGRVVPARPGVKVIVEVLKSGGYVTTAAATTTASGTYKTTVPYGRGNLATYQVRTRYVTANRPTRSEASTAHSFKRIAVINAVLSTTTAAEVAKTYHAGCPVGRSKLRTITMNFYGFDKRMHRGVLIVRKDLTSKVIRGFSSALTHKYPVAKMNNPNVYGGSDPKQMAANNTSGFNCRKVVGNPYKMSPHSYGIAVDVNTVQNPYRDSRGKWWPANGKPYIKRTPKKWGMLTKSSYLTKSLRKDKFFWGGFWYPGRDYQHFEYRG